MKYIFFAGFLMLCGYSFSQSVNAVNFPEREEVIRVDVDKINKETQVLIQMPFAGVEIQNPQDIDLLKGKLITKVELVYTAYRLSPAFSQQALNRKRLKILHRNAPFVFDNKLTAWKYISQTGCTSPEEGREMFHGFIITFRQESTAASIEKEIAHINRTISGNPELPPDYVIREPVEEEIIPSAAHLPPVKGMPAFNGGERALKTYLQTRIPYPEEDISGGKEGMVYISFTVGETGRVSSPVIVSSYSEESGSRVQKAFERMPDWHPGRMGRFAVRTSFMLPVKFSLADTSVTVRGLINSGEYSGRVVAGGSGDALLMPDTALLAIMERNRGWKNMLVVCDVTGSMSPYTAQIMLWFKSQMAVPNHPIKHVLFFNDGDNKSNEQKIIGQTGGIYHTPAKDFKTVKKIAFQTMRRGGGGDTPENNIEALIEGSKICPECNEIVMIADNFATPRDLSLQLRITTPVRVILCGTQGSVNTGYMDFVRINRGSLHTMSGDYYDLKDMHEGDAITINGKNYRINGGKFEYVVE